MRTKQDVIEKMIELECDEIAIEVVTEVQGDLLEAYKVARAVLLELEGDKIPEEFSLPVEEWAKKNALQQEKKNKGASR